MEELTEQELAEIYAKIWNNLDAEIVEPYLADEVIYESQVVFTPLAGKKAVLDYLRGKITTIKNNLESSDVYAELGFCGSQDDSTVKVLSAEEFRPCILMAQGKPENILALVLLEIDDGKIKRIDLCSVAPHPSTAMRTGHYPTL